MQVKPPQGVAGMTESLVMWLREEQPEALQELWRQADVTRAQFAGDEVGVWGAVKVSNYCDDECVFCGLRAGNRTLARYRMETDEILACARQAVELGCRMLLLQSGRDPQLTVDGVGETIRRVRGEMGLSVGLSLGERSEMELAAWRRAGAEAYLLRFMTANTTLYRLLHGMPIEDPRRRLPLLATLRRLGFRVGSGLLVGFPGQSHESLAEDLDLLRKLDLDVVLVGPYIWPEEFGAWRKNPQPGDANSAQAVLKTVSLARQLCPGADIPATAALSTVGSPEALGLALQRGANVVVVDLTPSPFREAYRCYPGRDLPETGALSGMQGLRAAIERWRHGAATASTAQGTVGVQDKRLHVCLCMGSSCFSRGNNRTVAAVKGFIAQHGLEKRVALEGHLCEGLCKDGPNVTIEGCLLQRAETAQVTEAIQRHPRLKD